LSFLENQGQTTIIGLILGSSMLALISCTLLLPRPLSVIVGGVLYLGIIVGGFGFGQLYVRDKYIQHPMVQLVLRPTNFKMNLFFRSGRSRPLKNGTSAMFLDLTWPKKILDFPDKQEQVAIIYPGQWQKDHVNYHGLDIDVAGFSFTHPNADLLVVKQFDKNKASLDHGIYVPVFKLISGSKTDVPISDTESVDLKTVTDPVIKLKIANLQDELQNTKSRADEATSENHRLEEVVHQQERQIDGLMRGKGGIKEFSIEYLTTIIDAVGSLKGALKNIKGTSISDYFKYILIGFAVLLIILYLNYNPSVVDGIIRTMNNPLVVIAIALVAVAVIILALRWRRRK